MTIAGTSILLFGWESWQAYIDLTLPLQAEIMNEGSGSFLNMMPSAYMSLRLLEIDLTTRTALQAIFGGIALVGVFWTFARCPDQDLRFGVLVTGTFLASPYCFNYDMTTLSLAVALVVLRALREGFLPGERVVLALTWLLPSAVFYLNSLEAPVAPLVLFSCFACLLIRVRNARHCGTSAVSPGLPSSEAGAVGRSVVLS